MDRGAVLRAPLPPMQRKKARSFPIVAGITLAAIMTIAVWSRPGQGHPSDRAHRHHGIDVSHHQKRIDWSALPAQGVDFAYIKASEGGDHRDRRFALNWAGAARVGIKRGAYHYFSLCRSGAAQAANFIAAVPRDPAALAPAVDLEFLGNCTARPHFTGEAFHRELTEYLRRVEAHYGRQAILYLTEEFDMAMNVSKRHDRPLWLRSLGREPDFGARPWTIWQVSHSRRLKGIQGHVDWNVMR